jgi:hypothetical protein
MKSWFRLRCSCGARWDWWGTTAESQPLRIMFERAHQGPGHAVRETG